MKHDEKNKRFRKQRSAPLGSPVAEPGPTLREFWAELQRAKAVPPPAADGAVTPGAPATWSSWSSGSFRSSGSGGSGSGGLGYGLALISSDPESQERIRRIMRSLCEKDAKHKP